MRPTRVLLFLGLAVLLLPAIGCFVSFPHEDAHYYYPSDLGGGGEQLYAWPASRKDEFRFFVQRAGNGLGDSNSPVEALHATSDSEQIDSLAAHANSLTFLLPADADARVREDVRGLVERLWKAQPALSTHCITIRTAPGTIESGADLHRVLTREASFHEESRPAGFGVQLLNAIGKVWSMAELPNFVVVPLDSGANLCAVYGDLRLKGEAAPCIECSADEVAGILQSGLRDPEARKLTGSWGNVDGGGRSTVSFGGVSGVFVAVYLPQGVPAERRAQCAALATQLCTSELAPIVVAQADTSWEWKACVNSEFVRKRLPLDGDKSFITGPVHQAALLPRPEK